MIELLNVWCDGACAGNPGPGGYSAAIINKDSTVVFFSGYDDFTTNNRMELRGFISALKLSLNEVYKGFNGSIIIHTDSKYIENAINCNWLDKWIKKDFQKIKNDDLWRQIYLLINEYRFITVKWVKGHSGIVGNDIVDRLAVEAMNLKRTSNGIIEI